MTRILFLIFLIPFISLGQTRYTLSKAASLLTWECNYVLGKGHKGTLDIQSGSVTVNEKEILIKGDFVLDMNSITTTDDKKEQKKLLARHEHAYTFWRDQAKRTRNDLEEHLSSADFFDTAQFPTGNFSITQVNPINGKMNEYIITGYLSLKGITNLIQFPATIVNSKGFISAKAQITIDRTKWNINYQSGSIFTNLKNGIISDEIKISLDLMFARD